MKTSNQILVLFSQNYQKWLKLSTQQGLEYQKQLSAEQTKWVLDVFNRESHCQSYQSDVTGRLTLPSGQTISYRLVRIRDGAGLLTIVEIQP